MPEKLHARRFAVVSWLGESGCLRVGALVPRMSSVSRIATARVLTLLNAMTQRRR
jgi:hypothetical protein